MVAISPMLRHAFESFEHGIMHYLDHTPLGRKFALLHVDHAIELALKEKVVQLGQSIYRKDGRTISVHEAFEKLDKVSIPEKPRLEDLHDFRNVVQHKGLTPDELTTEFNIDIAYKFFKRFLKDELGVEIGDVLPRPYIHAMEGVAEDIEQLAADVRKRLEAAEQLFSSGVYEMAVVSGFTALEVLVRSKVKEEKTLPLVLLLQRLVKSAKVAEPDWGRFQDIQKVRNLAAHTGQSISRDDARKVLDELMGLIQVVNKIDPPTA